MHSNLNDAFGRAYGRPLGESDPILTQTGPGTPGGELLRRYWQPIALSSEATARPKKIRRFGEDLILFRNKGGEAGLLTPHCIHRGADLFYGKVEDDGIRCCYHGWKFGCQGQVLEQPCEPDGGAAKHKLRQPWYPVVEKYGAIFTYMGPPERQPLFPRYSSLEGLGEDEEVVASYISEKQEHTRFPCDYNWFQEYDNTVDHYHLTQLHIAISGFQFADERWLIEPEVAWRPTEAKNSVMALTSRNIGGGKFYVRVEQGLIPNLVVLPPFYHDGPAVDVFFIIPFDDHTFVRMQILKQKKGFKFNITDFAAVQEGQKPWGQMSPAERQASPNDYEAQHMQGPQGIDLHSNENLAASDRGVVMQRLLWKRQAKIVAEGGDPVGVAFNEADRMIKISAGSAVIGADELDAFWNEGDPDFSRLQGHIPVAS